MARDLNLKLDLSTKDAVRNLKDAQKASSGLSSEFEEGASSGKRLAAAIRTVSDNAKSDLLAARAATESLSSALGDEFVAEVKEAGGSVDGLVQDLKRLGLSYDEITADADELAAAMRHASVVNKEFGDDLNVSARHASDGLDQVTRSGDQSRSVLANMVGNSVQDLGQLGGVAGSAGVMIGQLGEYAADGNIQLSQLAKFAGPMLGVAAATSAISWALAAQERAAAEAKREMELLLDVQRQLAEGDIAGASKTLAEEYADTIPLLKEFGLGASDLIDTINGSSVAIDNLKSQQQALKDEYAATSPALVEERQALLEKIGTTQSLIDTLDEAQTAAEDAAESDRIHKQNVEEVNAALLANIDITDKAANRTNQHAVAIDRAAVAADKEAKALKGIFDTIDGDSAVLNLIDQYEGLQQAAADAEEAAATGAANAGQANRQYAQSLNDTKREIANIADQVLGLPAERITEILADIDERGFAAVEDFINQVARERTAVIRTQVIVGGEKDDYAKRNAAAANAFKITTPPKTGGGGGGGSRGGGGGGGGSSVAAKADDPMTAWDAAIAKAYQYGEITLDQYRKYLTDRLGAYDKYSDEYFGIWNDIQKLNADEAKAAEDAAKAKQKRLDDEAAAEKKRLDEIAAVEEKARKEKEAADKEAADEADRLRKEQERETERARQEEQRAKERAAREADDLARKQFEREYDLWLEGRNLKRSDVIRRGEVSDAAFEQLQREGWIQSDIDNVDALYRPGDSARAATSTSTTTINQFFPPGVSPTGVAVATRDYARRGGRQ